MYQKEHRQALPSAVVSADGYGRMARLVAHGVPVTVKLNIQAKFGADHVDGENVIGDIPGTDPALKDQVVMMGGHLDSWIAGTGATDNGAGTIIALEAMRILKTLGLHPRRTIRIGLWGGEEQGIFGSLGYVNSHLATIGFSTDPAMKNIPVFAQAPASVTPKPDAGKFDVYFNIDNGGGRLLGIYAENNLEAARLFRQWGEPVRDLGFESVSMRGTASTDHVNFDMAGLPGFQFVQDRRDYGSRTHHTNLDTYERLSEAGFETGSYDLGDLRVGCLPAGGDVPAQGSTRSGYGVQGRHAADRGLLSLGLMSPLALKTIMQDRPNDVRLCFCERDVVTGLEQQLCPKLQLSGSVGL